MAAQYKITQTHDGSKTLCNNLIDETYHSIHGAMTEANHVFIAMGLGALREKKTTIRVFEMGFGTGLNALLTLHWAKQNDTRVHYTTIESNPVPWPMVSALNYTQITSLEDMGLPLESLHQVPWNKEHRIDDYFQFTKVMGLLESYADDGKYDVIFYDAFSPEKQPELWTLEIFKKLKAMLCPTGQLVTYCAKGYVRRNMISAGLSIERLPGPPGKREMLRATFLPNVI